MTTPSTHGPSRQAVHRYTDLKTTSWAFISAESGTVVFAIRPEMTSTARWTMFTRPFQHSDRTSLEDTWRQMANVIRRSGNMTIRALPVAAAEGFFVGL